MKWYLILTKLVLLNVAFVTSTNVTSYTLPGATQNLGKISATGNISVVGGTDYFLVIDHRTNNVTKMQLNPSKRDLCQRYGNIDCYNFIKVIEKIDDNSFLICGTNAKSPSCWNVNVQTYTVSPSRLTSIRDWLPVTQNSKITTGLLPHSSGNELYTSSCVSLKCKTTRQITNPLKSYDINKEWYNKADFLNMHFATDDSKIYNFYRDERSYFLYDGFTSGGSPAMYGMVSRLCRADRGGGVRMTDNWMTFMSARLLCPSPGGSNLGRLSNYYNYMRSTYQIGNTVFAVFGFPSSWGMPATAVCAYDLNVIDTYMDGTVFSNNITLYYDGTGAPYSKTYNELGLRPGQCPTSSLPTTSVPGPYQTFIQNSVIIANSVKPISGKPLYIHNGDNFDFQVGEQVGDYNVLYLIKADGTMHKLRMTTGGAGQLNGSVLLSKSMLNISQPILSVSLVNKVMIIVTSQEVLRISSFDCSSYKSCDTCEADPDCDWLVGNSVYCGSANSVSVSTCPAPPASPSGQSSTTTGTNINLSWNAVSGTEYVVTITKKSDNLQVYQRVVNSSPLVLQKSSLPQGERFVASVQAMMSRVLSPSANMEFQTSLSTPVVSATHQRSDDVTITWGKVPLAVNYKVDVLREAETLPFLSYIIVAMPTAAGSPSVRIHGLRTGEEYKVEISAISSSNVESEATEVTFVLTDPTSAYVSTTTPVTVTTIRATPVSVTTIRATPVSVTTIIPTPQNTTPMLGVMPTSHATESKTTEIQTTPTEAVTPAASARVECWDLEDPKSMETTYITLILIGLAIIIIAIGILMQNHLSIGIRNNTLKPENQNQVLRRKWFLLWIRNESSGAKYNNRSERIAEEKLNGEPSSRTDECNPDEVKVAIT
ncbi:uncharacterized protein LOC100179332 isoform X1 [Ciona intestinalis]